MMVCEGCGTGMLQCMSQGGSCCYHCDCKKQVTAQALRFFSGRDREPVAPRSARLISGTCVGCLQPLYGKLCWNPGCGMSVPGIVRTRWPEHRGPIIETRGEEIR